MNRFVFLELDEGFMDRTVEVLTHICDVHFGHTIGTAYEGKDRSGNEYRVYTKKQYEFLINSKPAMLRTELNEYYAARLIRNGEDWGLDLCLHPLSHGKLLREATIEYLTPHELDILNDFLIRDRKDLDPDEFVTGAIKNATDSILEAVRVLIWNLSKRMELFTDLELKVLERQLNIVEDPGKTVAGVVQQVDLAKEVRREIERRNNGKNEGNGNKLS